ncbi:MAG: hypothetical protein IPL52_08535 [Flavobacteriales bacterium]|nr:hypothetical protein [Flavobacteriales bacterium]
MRNTAASLLIALLLPAASKAQRIPDPDSILITGPIPKVLLVGTFHFEYYDLDAHVTDKDKRVNVKDPRRQREMEELVDHIARFKPTAIAVEAGANTGWLIRRYRDYQRSDSLPRADEREQIGFRLMKRFGIDTLYGVDAPTLLSDLWDHPDSTVLHPILDSIYADWDFTNDDAISQRYKEYYRSSDAFHVNHTLLESFMYHNADKTLDRDYGAYLNGDFKLGKYRGADGLAMHWYARNLRILRNIQELHLKPEDRLVVIYGAGHMGILKHLFECTPEFELVKFGEL